MNSAREFTLTLDRFKGMAREQFVLVQKKIGIDLLGAFQLGNPVRTGRSRSGWTVSAGLPSTSAPPKLPSVHKDEVVTVLAGHALVASAEAADARVMRIVFGQPSFVVNNVEYVGHLNDRHPRSAGFFESGIELVSARYQLGSPT